MGRRPEAPGVIVPMSPGGPDIASREDGSLAGNRVEQLANNFAAAIDGGHVSVRRAAALVGLPIEGLEELFAVHRVEPVIDL